MLLCSRIYFINNLKVWLASNLFLFLMTKFLEWKFILISFFFTNRTSFNRAVASELNLELAYEWATYRKQQINGVIYIILHTFLVLERASVLFACFDLLEIKVKWNLRITVQKYSRVFMKSFKECSIEIFTSFEADKSVKDFMAKNSKYNSILFNKLL